MMNEWNFPKWQQQIKNHEKITEKTYKEYQKKMQNSSKQIEKEVC